MPGLAGVDEVAAGRDGGSQPAQRAARPSLVGEQLVQARDDAQVGFGSTAASSRSKASALLEAGDPGKAAFRRSGARQLDIEIGVVAQHDRIAADAPAVASASST